MTLNPVDAMEKVSGEIHERIEEDLRETRAIQIAFQVSTLVSEAQEHSTRFRVEMGGLHGLRQGRTWTI